jgi:hypothetical protein
MYINKIDDLLDKIIDDFYARIILKEPRLLKIIKEFNFVKYQSDINDILKNYILTINLNELKEIIKNNDIINTIIEVIKKYIAIYLFLFIGYHYQSTDKMYSNNIVEFSKNQPEYGFKIDGFFNSESNALILDFYTQIKQILNLLTIENKQQREILKSKVEYKKTINFLNTLGSEFIQENIAIEDKNFIRSHNIIKIIIILQIYKTFEKKDLFRLLELLETSEGEFIFIDIVVPIKTIIDIKTIESLLSKKEIQSGKALEIWDYINETDSDLIKDMTIDEKILTLINKKIFIPITDDLLLFHKDTESYDKSGDVKKKEDTKIRYIINKIDVASNLNIGESHSEAKKKFYTPMNYKKVVLINDIENIKIINKFTNQSKLTPENSSNLKDLEDTVIYPYINLRDSENSFLLKLTHTIDSMRYINFETSKEFKQRPNAYIDMRIGTKNIDLNVVGLYLRNSFINHYCLKNKNLVNILDYDKKHKNGVHATLDYINENIINKGKKSINGYYWLFNSNADKIDMALYDQENKFTITEQIKHTIGFIYDEIEKYIFEFIINKLKNNKKITLNDIYNFIDSYCTDKIKITNKKLLLKLEKKIYTELLENKEIKYDLTDDIVYGLSDKSIKLPEIDLNQFKSPIKTIAIDLSILTETGEYEEKEEVIGVCQHNVTWERLSELRKSNPQLFLNELFQFIQQYVIENVDHDFICKSCGYDLNIKKYVADGSFDDETHTFITYSTPLDTPIEDIPEYEKFRGTIRNIDKLIEKISLISGLNYFIGATPTIKSRRKLVVKDCIDIVIENNRLLKNLIKDRYNTIGKLYGLNKDYSNLFAFELENSIFIFSSKDKDVKKQIKNNNIIGYIIILIALELNESQILYFNPDKKGYCNFQIFDKIYTTLFEGLKIRKNNMGDTIKVTDYPIFCYILYMLSCYVAKNQNLWFYDFKDGEDKNKRLKLLPVIQKIIIHTVIDIINSCLENFEINKSKNKIFEIFRSKFYKKLNTVFSNTNLYERLKEENKSSTIGDKKAFILVKAEAIPLDGKYLTQFDLVTTWRKIKPHRLFIDTKSRQPLRIEHYTNVTLCDSGSFHQWSFNSANPNTLTCKLCNQKSSETEVDESKTKKIIDALDNKILNELTKKNCMSDGYFHNFNEKGICTKCNKKENDTYTKTELDKLNDYLIKNKIKLAESTITNNIEKQKTKKETLTYDEKLKDKIYTDYSQAITNDNPYKYIDDLIAELENNLNYELLKDNNILKHNLYIFNHDHLGVKLDKNIVITEKENKVKFELNHPFFKTNVIYYTTYKNGRIDVFYDSQTKILLGYKEENKNYVMNIQHDKLIKIVYSIYNKLKMLGYNSEYINLAIEENNIEENFEQNKNTKIKNIINTRKENISHIIYRFQRLITRIVNSYVIPKPKKEDHENKKYIEDMEFFNNKFDSLIEKYTKHLNSINIVSQNGSHMIFKHWSGVSKINFKDVKENIIDDINDNNILYYKLSKIDTNGNIILYYFVNEILKLYKYNDNSVQKSYLTNLIIDFINIYFDMYNEEKYKIKMDYKNFWYIINSSVYIDEIKEKIGETEGIYEEAVDPDKQELTPEEQDAKDDAEEEEDALDVEGDEYDYEAYHSRNLDRELDPEFIEKASQLSYIDYLATF